MKCQKCNKTSANDENSCPFCGTAFFDAPQQANQNQPFDHARRKLPKPEPLRIRWNYFIKKLSLGKRITIISVAIILIVGIVLTSILIPNNQGNTNGERNEATVSNTVKVLTQKQSETFVNSAKPVDISGENLVIELPNNISFSVGDIFMVRPTKSNPYGFSGKVEKTDGNRITVSQPPLDEMFETFSVDVDKNLKTEDVKLSLNGKGI